MTLRHQRNIIIRTRPISRIIMNILYRIMNQTRRVRRRRQRRQRKRQRRATTRRRVVRARPIHRIVPHVNRLATTGGLGLLYFQSTSMKDKRLRFFREGTPFYVEIRSSNGNSNHHRHNHKNYNKIDHNNTNKEAIIMMIILRINMSIRHVISRLSNVGMNHVTYGANRRRHNDLTGNNLTTPMILSKATRNRTIITRISRTNSNANRNDLARRTSRINSRIMYGLLQQSSVNATLSMSRFVLKSKDVNYQGVRQDQANVFRNKGAPFMRRGHQGTSRGLGKL